VVVQQVQQNLQDVLHDCGGTLRTTIPPAGFRVRKPGLPLYSIFFQPLVSHAIKYRDGSTGRCSWNRR
jgi:hypothetical protein